MKIRNSHWKLLIAIPLVLYLIACDKGSNEPEPDPCNPENSPGQVLEAAFFATFNPSDVQTYLTLLGAPPGLTPQYSVDAYSVVYMTRDINENLIQVSGALFVPQDIDTLDLLSVQHGTEFNRSQVGSANPLWALDGMICAMDGFMVFEPDYIGLGVSEQLHPYLHAKLSANSVVDGLRAARIYACQNDIQLDPGIFLAGYSEGGFVTLAAHQELEEMHGDEFTIRAVAPMAGPHDLLQTTTRMLKSESYSNPAYIAYIVAAYNDVYGWNRLTEIFQSPYAEMIPLLLNGTHDGSDVNDSLTQVIDELFNPVFVQDFLDGSETDVRAALWENSPLRWGPLAPVRLYHGTADSTVYFENSRSAYDSLRFYGGQDVSLVPLTGANHGSGAFPSYYLALSWFDSLRTI